MTNPTITAKKPYATVRFTNIHMYDWFLENDQFIFEVRATMLGGRDVITNIKLLETIKSLVLYHMKVTLRLVEQSDCNYVLDTKNNRAIFTVKADFTKTFSDDIGQRFGEFLQYLPQVLAEGTQIRRDKTRKIYGLESLSLSGLQVDINTLLTNAINNKETLKEIPAEQKETIDPMFIYLNEVRKATTVTEYKLGDKTYISGVSGYKVAKLDYGDKVEIVVTNGIQMKPLAELVSYVIYDKETNKVITYELDLKGDK